MHLGTAANAAYKAKDFAAAASMYRSLIESTNSTDPKLLKNFGMASLKLESFEVAKEYCARALANCTPTQVGYALRLFSHGIQLYCSYVVHRDMNEMTCHNTA